MLQSIAVILSVNGRTLDAASLGDLPRGRLVRAEFASGEQAACVAATLEHDCPPEELVAALRHWAADRGWTITVAPLGGHR